MATYLEDSFNDTLNVELKNHTPDTGTGWTQQSFTFPPTDPIFAVQTNRTVKAKKVISVAHFGTVANGPLPTDYEVIGEVRLNPSSSQQTESIGIMVRAADASGDNIYGYAGVIFTTPTQYKRGIIKWNNASSSSPTIVQSENFTYDGTFRTLRLVVEGSTLSFFMSEAGGGQPNTLVFRTTDTDISAANKPGIFFEMDDTGNNIRIRGAGSGVFTYVCRAIMPLAPLNSMRRNDEMLSSAYTSRIGLKRDRLANIWR